jgi:ankyrin repeat protein
MKKDIPLISQLLKAIIVEDYASAIEIVTSDKFNPNETNESWHAPVLTAIVCVLSTTDKATDQANLKEILKEIVKNEKFNPNILDTEGETVLMHIARHPSFNWLVPFIMNTGKVDITVKNFMHRDAIEIAESEGNTTLADILLPLKAHDHKGQPRKRVGIKKITKVTTINVSADVNDNVINRIEKAFGPDNKKNPVSLYNLLSSFFKGDYTTCMEIVRDPNFNPNECDKWDEPALSSLIYYSQDAKASYNEEMFKDIADAIIKNRRFDVNALDADCNTVLMVAMGFPKLHWLTEMLFSIQSARLDVMNDSGETIRQIAENCGNGEFYNHLVRKSFEAAEVVN